MPTDYLGSRREWFLPLFGGAEMNRIKQPEITYFTSQMYPYQLVDTMTSGAGLAPSKDAWLLDFVGTGLGMLDGTSRDSLIAHSMSPEHVQADFGMLEGSSFGVVYHAYKASPEYTQTTVSLLDGTSIANLVRYTNWVPEYLTSSPIILDGTST